MFATDINSPNLKANKHSCCPFPFHLRQISITFCKIRFFMLMYIKMLQSVLHYPSTLYLLILLGPILFEEQQHSTAFKLQTVSV